MSGFAFEWDRQKDSANQRKHGVSFAEASTVYGDPLSITVPDPDDALDEERFVIVGMSIQRTLLIGGSYYQTRADSPNQRPAGDKA